MMLGEVRILTWNRLMATKKSSVIQNELSKMKIPDQRHRTSPLNINKPYDWCGRIIADMLEHEKYIGQP